MYLLVFLNHIGDNGKLQRTFIVCGSLVCYQWQQFLDSVESVLILFF